MKKTLHGTVNLPGSKSESNRALMIAAYGGFPLEADGLSNAHDTLLLKQLLAQTSTTFDCEDAGTVARFLLTYLANKPGTWTLTGTERLRQRPMAPLIDALRQLNAVVSSDTLPVAIQGRKLGGGHVAIDASQSSQFASSLIMAAPTWERGLKLTMTGNPVSMPYLEMTIQMMEYFGVHVDNNGHEITVAHQSYRPRPFRVSADWSAASYWYEMMALSDGGELLLKGLKADSLQGDAVVAQWFKPLGVITTFESEGARLTKGPVDLHNLVFDFTNTPDLYPAVYSTCVALNIEAVFKGTATLSDKESDRLKALNTELSHLGEDRVFRTYGDHRIAMALASLWPLFGPIAVDDPLTVNKSYPGFWDDLFRM